MSGGRAAGWSPAVRAVVFDMDGLIFDSERAAREAWRAALLARGFELSDEVYLRAVGRTAAEARAVFVRAFGDDLPVEAVEEDKARRLLALLGEAPPLKPGLGSCWTRPGGWDCRAPWRAPRRRRRSGGGSPPPDWIAASPWWSAATR